jgi:hypothetical protein
MYEYSLNKEALNLSQHSLIDEHQYEVNMLNAFLKDLVKAWGSEEVVLNLKKWIESTASQ